MTYDPNPTTVMAPTQVSYPITDEFPAVGPGPGGGWVRGLSLLAMVMIIGVAGFFAANWYRDRDAAAEIAEQQAPAPTPVPVDPDVVGPAPTVPAANAGADWWQVVNVEQGLNVRAGPGTANDVVGALGPGQRHVFSTGERDGEWMQIVVGDDVVGWVSSRFLSPDTEPAAGEPAATVAPAPAQGSTVCFASDAAPGRVARLDFVNRVEITGQLLTGSGDSAVLESVSGTLDSGQAVITLTNAISGESTRQSWIFNPATIDLGNGISLAVVNCSAIGL